MFILFTFCSLLYLPTVIILNIGTDRSEQTVETQIRLLLMEQSDQGLLCLLFCLHLLTQYCTVKSNCSNCRTIMVIISDVPIFRIFTVFTVKHIISAVSNFGNLTLKCPTNIAAEDTSIFFTFIF